MFKRVLMVFILGVSIIALRGSDVDAHLAGYTYSPTFRHVSSYDCLGHFAQVPSPAQHPALFECRAVVQAFQVLCANPQGKVVTPGTPSGPITLIGEDFFREADITDKTKGKAEKTITFPDEGSPLLDDALCQERNRNWQTIDELVLTVDVTLKTFDCVAVGDDPCGDREQAYEALLRCTVPDGYSLPNNPLVGLVDYNCSLIGEEHCDQTGACPIQPIPFP